MLKPRAGYIIATPHEGVKETKTGILLSETQERDGAKAVVVRVAKDISHIQPGDLIIHKSYNSTELDHDGETQLIIHVEDVMAIINV